MEQGKRRRLYNHEYGCGINQTLTYCYKYIEDIIKNENAQVQNILELACGTGNLTIPLTKKNYDIAGIDISEMLSVARKKQKKKVLNWYYFNKIYRIRFLMYRI